MDKLIVIDPAGRDIHGEAARLRSIAPAVRVQLPDGIEAWAVTHHEALKSLLTDDRVSKDPRLHWPAWQQGRFHGTWVAMWLATTNLLNTYGHDHARLRRLVAPAFTARSTRALRPEIEAITASLLDGLADHPADEIVDLRAAYAHPLPVAVICRLFGIGEEARADVTKLLAAFLDTQATPEQVQSTFGQVHELFDDLIAQKRARPADDLTSVLVSGRDEDGSTLTESELRDMLMLLVGAGFETTVNLIGNSIHALLTHPAHHQAVLTGGLSWDQVVEETLRWDPSIASVALRFAIEDIDLGDGIVIPAGDAILASFAGAGRDPQTHGADADRFDPARAISEHLAFGYGVHRCIGAPLARLEADIALRAIFARYPHMDLVHQDIPAVQSFIANGRATLPVRLGDQRTGARHHLFPSSLVPPMLHSEARR
jgi:cytochrome P450